MSKTKTVKLHTVAKEDSVSLDFSGLFYKRILGAYFNYVSKFTTEEFELILAAISQNKIDSLTSDAAQVDARSIETMLILISSVEQKFQDAGMIKPQDIEVPNED